MTRPHERAEALQQRIEELSLRLEEAEDTLRAIREGEVDGLVVRQGERTQVFTLKGADHAYRVLFETLNEGAVTLGAEGMIFYANTRFAAMVGMPLSRLPSTSFVQFVAAEDRLKFADLLARGIRGSGKGEILLQAADGTVRPVLLSLNAVHIEGAEGTCTAVLTDLTELRAAQEALREANAELEARVEARTAELVRANAELERADRAKDAFLAMLAHELRNPLAPILNSVQILRRLELQEPRLARIQEIIQRQVAHQARLLDDLLNVSRIAQGKITLQTERLDLVRLVREGVEDNRGVLQAAGLTIELGLPDAPLWVEGDPTRLSQVIGNLLANAAKFTERGGTVAVTLGCDPVNSPRSGGGAERRGPGPRGDTERERKGAKAARDMGPPQPSFTQSLPLSLSVSPCLRVDNPSAVVTVRDSGIGIEAGMLPHVFEAFMQADRSLDRSRGGLGLGLAMVKGIVELHGGQVTAQSDGPGQGATFTLCLPLAPAGATETAAPAPALAAVPVRVLIVEDHADTAETMQSLLELSGCTVAVARSGPEALAQSASFHPEVVLCDLGLPVMDGYQVAAALRRLPATARARLIALSGYGREEDRRRSQEAGFHVHLVKPVEFAALEALLCEKNE